MTKDTLDWCNLPLRSNTSAAGAQPSVKRQDRNSLQAPIDQRQNELVVKSERSYAKLSSTAPTVAFNLNSEGILKHQFAQNDHLLAKQYARPVFTKPNERNKRAPMPSLAQQVLEKAPRMPVFGSSDRHHLAPHVQTKIVSTTPSSDAKSFVGT